MINRAKIGTLCGEFKNGLTMKLSKFLSSRTGKRFYNLCYCWGACLVILGAVFKIAHMPYDNLLLMIGLFTEVFIFFISGFDEPAREYKGKECFRY